MIYVILKFSNEKIVTIKNKILKDNNHKLKTKLDKIKSFAEKFTFSS